MNNTPGGEQLNGHAEYLDGVPPLDDSDAYGVDAHLMKRSPEKTARVPPQNLDAERSVLGGVLLDNEALNQIRELLKPEDFYRDAHRKVFEAMCALSSRDEPIDRVTLKDELTTLGVYEAMGGEDFIDLLDKVVPSAANLTYYANIVHDKALRRRMIEASQTTLAEAYGQVGDVGDLLADARRRVDDAAGAAITALDKVCRDLTPNELREDPEPQKYVWKPYIPAGRASVLSGPGGGLKTTLTVHAAVCRAHGIPFLDGAPADEGHTTIVTLEDGRPDYVRKLAALRVEMGDAYDAGLVAERVHIMDLSGEPFRMVEAERGQYSVTPAVDELAQTIRRRWPETSLIVMETLSRLTGGAEGNEANSIVIEAAQRLCKLTSAAVVLVGHVSQDAGRRGVADQYAGRGGSALGDNGRSSMVLTRLTPENAKKYAPGANLSDEEMERLVVFTHPKSNGAPPAPPLILERHGNEHGPVLRRANLHCRRGQTDATLIAQLCALVAGLNAASVSVTARSLRDRHKEFGLSEKRMGALVEDAIKNGVLHQSEKPSGRGGGLQLTVVSGPRAAERKPDWRDDV